MEGDPTTGTQIRWRCSISIHSLRMEGDSDAQEQLDDISISIHSLRMEGDTIVNTALVEYMIFQSTPSAWRETSLIHTIRNKPFISIHSLRMEGDSFPAQKRT